ncbi:MAG: HAMP domain-containing protein [Desulfobacteraceae bacterium]|nr:MAG: HAMP domain-containing protein [Desulfobacteraceae bacterium]
MFVSIREAAGIISGKESIMKRISVFPLNIRQKVILVLLLLSIVMLIIAAISFNSLLRIEQKQHFVVIADDLSNMILEIRRYEKNYLLYGSPEDLEENRKYIQRSLNVLERIYPDVKDLRVKPLLDIISRELLEYERIMILLSTRDAWNKQLDPVRVEEDLRDHGKNVLALSSELVSFERDTILRIIKNLKANLLTALGIFIALNVFLGTIVLFKIIKPLKIIEKTTLRIAEGNFTPIPVTSARDETQRVIQAFNRMVSELEKRQDQLVQAKKLSSLGTLTSGIAHQLNNPLNNISTSCQILIEELIPLLNSLTESDRQFTEKMLGNIEQEVHRAKDIVKGLLEFSREREFCLTPIFLGQVVERSVRLISSQIPPGIQIVHNIPPDLTLKMDSQRMQQVFLNLIENAVHSMKDAMGEIRIGAETSLSGNSVIITVEDTGKGIPEKVRPHIFDPFYTTKEVGAGTGLGLSIVYGIIQKHFGSISVESREGEGSRFTIHLPIENVC